MLLGSFYGAWTDVMGLMRDNLSPLSGDYVAFLSVYLCKIILLLANFCFGDFFPC